MRRTIFAAAAAAAVVAVAATALADAAPRAGGAPITLKSTLELTGVVPVDADRNGVPSQGDYELWSEVFHGTSGAVVGNGTAICFETDGSGRQFTCTGEADFGANELQVAFRFFPTSKTFRLAIRGGLGSYEGAYGQAIGTWLDPKDTRASMDFTIRTR